MIPNDVNTMGLSDLDPAHYVPVLARIQWHCEQCVGRHGVILGVSQDDMRVVTRCLEFYYRVGNKHRGCWGEKHDDDTWDIEFVSQVKVFPAPDRPWKVPCGSSQLFERWHIREREQAALKRQFKRGDEVWFIFEDRRYQGLISRINKQRATVMVANTPGFLITFNSLHHV